MTFSTNHSLQISVPVCQADREQAQIFAQQQPTPAQATQVYENTLAVLIARRYLEMLGIASDLDSSHSWNPIARLTANLADLYIPEVNAHLECRPVRQDNRACFIPEEVWTDRIGYIVVQLHEPCYEATILGFVPTVSVEQLPLNYLQPIENFIDQLAEGSVNTPAPTLTHLSQWLTGTLTGVWQSLEKLPRTSNLALTTPIQANWAMRGDELAKQVEQLYRSYPNALLPSYDSPTEALVILIQSIEDEETRWKAAELLWQVEPSHPATGVRRAIGLHLAGYRVALMVAVLPKQDGRIAIFVRVYPTDEPGFLPRGMKLLALDEKERSLFEVQSQTPADYIQFKFTADLGDRFRIRVSLENSCITENFVV